VGQLKHIRHTEPLDDEALVAMYQATHDQDVLATLYLRYTDLVYGTALKYLKDHELAKDAVMNIYQELVVKLKEHQVDNFKGWLYVLTRNHCLMWLRKHKKQITVEFQPEIMQSGEEDHLETLLEKEKQLKQLEHCVETLQTEQQKAIRLFYLEGKCYHEIAEQTDLGWDKVRSLIQNGRRNLKICMEKNG
jgi:RNA polymerase sigma-70 factor (ECF subfamily)